METPIIPTAKAMRHLTCMKLVPENIMKTIIEDAKAGKEYISFEDEFNIMTCEVIWALETLGYKVYKEYKESNETLKFDRYTIKWF
jgi:hypothetical protein